MACCLQEMGHETRIGQLISTKMSVPAPTPATRHEAHFDQRVIRCFSDRPRCLYAMLAAAVERYPEELALVCDDVRLSWRELDINVGRIAAGLAEADSSQQL